VIFSGALPLIRNILNSVFNLEVQEKREPIIPNCSIIGTNTSEKILSIISAC
jgi:hypothetical protein